MVLGDGPLERLVRQPVQTEPEQQRLCVVEAMRPLGPHIPADDLLLGRFVQLPHIDDGERHLGVRVHQLQGLAVAAQIEGSPQDGVPGDHPGHRVPEDRLVERADDPQAVDVVVRPPVGVELHLVDHADLEFGHGVRVDQSVRQFVPVLGGEQGERFGPGRRLPVRVPALPGHGADLRQTRRCRMAEQVLERERHPAGPRPPQNLDGADGVAAEIEEGVVTAHPAHPEHLAPDARQHFLHRPLRRGIGRPELRPFLIGCREAPGVDLALRGEGEVREVDEVVRDGVRGEMGGEPGAECGGDRWLLVGGGEVGGEGVGVGVGDVGLGDVGVLVERRFDFGGFEAVAADFDLLVGAAPVVQGAVRGPVPEVSGAVEAGAGGPVRIGDEAVGGERGLPGVPPGDPGAADVQLARHTDRHRQPVPVQHPHRQVGQRRADRRGAVPEVAGTDPVVGDVDGGLGDAVHVDEGGGVVAVPVRPGADGRLVQRLTPEHHRPQGQRGAALGVHRLQLAEGGGGLAEDAHLFPRQEGVEGVGVAGGVAGDDDEAGAGGEGAPDLPDGEVEGEAVELAPHVLAAGCDDGLGGGEQPGDVAVGDGSALGPARRTGGEDHIARLVR
ncbi:hypothetical protein GCM10010417_40540 [Streptomyces carpaticus]